ncbi:hypothetical protein [Photorhabdus viridis]|uniref:hypothetical protein n=1 Tax=Photorhabdus viridis TaxID=3163327 RepID=UPI003306F7C6
MTNTKPFDISKRLVWEAWKRIKSNGGAYGVDNISIEALFLKRLQLQNQRLFAHWYILAQG